MQAIADWYATWYGVQLNPDAEILPLIGSKEGIIEVASTTELRKDGTLLTKAEYLKDGKSSGGREVIYREFPNGEVKWK